MKTLTITTTTPQAVRIQKALGLHLGLTTEEGVNRLATAAEIKAELVGHLRNIVEAQERAAEVAKVATPDLGDIS